MKKQDFTCSIIAGISPKEALDAIMHVAGWWAKDTAGDTHHLNGTFTVHFGETSGTFKIIELIPEKKMVWDVVDCYLPIFKNVKDWMGTRICWDISTEGKLTTISFTHIGLAPGKECYEDCSGGWTFFVTESLYKLITKGKGVPGVGIRSTISLGDRIYKGTLFFKNDPLPEFSADCLVADVKEILGEHVLSIHSVERWDKEKFNPQQIRGDHYMIISNQPVYGDIGPLQDILETIKNTNNMKKQDYHAVITAGISPKEAFDQVSNMQKWWTENLEGSTQHLGDVFTVRFGDTFVTFKTTEVVPDKKITWLVTDCNLHWLKDKKEWNGTSLCFEIAPGKDGTQISFTHIGLVPEIECFNDCRKGWDQYIKDSLYKLLTEGKGQPERKKMQTA